MAKSEPKKVKTRSKSLGVLHARLSEIEAEAARAQSELARARRLVELAERSTDDGKPVTTRIDDLLAANSDLHFSPSEIVEIVHASDETVKKALFRLLERGRIERVGHGFYRINGWDALRRHGGDH